MYKSEEQNEWTAKAGPNLLLRTWTHKSLVSMHVATEDDVHAGRVEQALHRRLHVVTLALMGEIGVVPAAGRPRLKVRGRLRMWHVWCYQKHVVVFLLGYCKQLIQQSPAETLNTMCP
jgi:hypothetical protein